jgi:hypothetical protein
VLPRFRSHNGRIVARPLTERTVDMRGSLGGKAETVKWLVAMALAALVSYFTAIGTMQTEIAEIRAKQESFQGEVIRRLDDLKADVRELRGR